MFTECFYYRRAPRCYRRPSARIAVQSRFQIEGSAVLLASTLFTSITVFLLAYRDSFL